ncbi:hypothetical protein [Xanthomonas arboricola]|uniref:hypothetical protein n=1 Tax=Xanthomonas arboricola TaxID=56448 RepID=UPI00118B04E7|nr:hypothetical protein [Xanthomonas arboricola]QDS16518.1 hypothetical protein FPL04_13370 [Xanthomonas arboricola]
MLTGFLLLAACKQEAATEKVDVMPLEKQQNLQRSQSTTVSQTRSSEGAERITSLYQVVSLLVAKNVTPWAIFDSVPGVQ